MLTVTAAGFRWQVDLILPGQAQAGDLVSLATRPAALAVAGLAVVVDWMEPHGQGLITDDPRLVEGFFHLTDGHRLLAVRPDRAILRWKLLA